MPPLEVWIAGALFVSLNVYLLTAGADFGGGVWDLLANGPRAKAQRDLIARAIAPIWEANHVWLILVVVLLFSAFSLAFSTITTALHIPLTLMLIGIVLRGTAFTFRAYGIQSKRAHRHWGRVFAISSVVTPIMLGVVAGAVASGTIRVDVESGQTLTDFVSAWLAPFPFAIGFFTLGVCAFLGAVYLILDTNETSLQEIFRKRALAAAVFVGAMALISFWLSLNGAPLIRAGLLDSGWSWPFHLATMVAALGAMWGLWARRYRWARVAAIAQVTLILWGWGLAQFPYLVVPDLTIANTAAPDSVLAPILVALLVGLVVLIPSFWALYRIFKIRQHSEGPC